MDEGGSKFSDYIIYADESGDHGLKRIDPDFPVFALDFCVMSKAEYVQAVVPAFQQLKFDFWGHDAIILHEHDIRKSLGPFTLLLTNRPLREAFYTRLSNLIEEAPLTIFTSVINKQELRNKYANPWNPYEIAMLFCMERLQTWLLQHEQKGKTVHVVFESRGVREDQLLEIEFRRICSGVSNWGYRKIDFSKLNLVPIFVSKAANSTGLQLADLTVRPIALKTIRPAQPNRAYEAISSKIEGMKCFP